MTGEPRSLLVDQALPAIRRERDRFAALSFCWADALLELDPTGRIVYCAGACRALFGMPAGALIGTAFADRLAPDDEGILADLLAQPPDSGRVAYPAVHLTGPGPHSRVAALTGFRLADLDGHVFVALRSRAIPERQEHAAEGGAESATEATSGLYDADDFVAVVTRRLAGGETKTRRSLSLILLTGYETLRQRLSEAGERDLVAALAACLKGSGAEGRVAGYLAADRYGLLHDADLDLPALEAQIAALTRSRDPAAAGTGVQTTTVSLTGDGASPAEIANGFLYTIKRFRSFKGSGFTLRSLSASMSALAREAAEAVIDFKRLTLAADFDVFFQPIVDVRSGSIHHYEALARFPSLGSMQSPYEHITFAEEVGLIADFDIAMVRKVIEWLAGAGPLNGEVSVAVNISGQSINSTPCLAALDALLRANPWARGRLMFEITESAHLGNLSAANAVVQRLRGQGYPVCLDDFGAGAANFEYLSSLEVDIVKLDGGAVSGARSAHKGKAFLKALVGLCRELGVATVAEMIEDEDGLEFVRSCGVRYVQGYLFGKPAADIGAFRRTIPARLFPLAADNAHTRGRVVALRRG
jgi:EAL domain-containing protein (putative c-di-GMP-specific phosphodiesterase class I)